MQLRRELHQERISSAQVNYELKRAIRELERRVQSPVLHTIELKVDELDYQAIQSALALRQSWRVLPDTDEPEANLAGRLVAEICRGWHERVLEDRSDRGREPFQPGDEGL